MQWATRKRMVVTWYTTERQRRGGQYPYPSLFESTGTKKKPVVGERKSKLSEPYAI